MRLFRLTMLSIGVPIFFLAIIINVGWKIAGSLLGSRLSNVEYPLGAGVVVASDECGEIFVGDAFNSRVQRYSPSGKFEYGFFVDAGGGVFRLWITSDNRLRLVGPRVGLLIYTLDGELISKSTIANRELDYDNAPHLESSHQYQVVGWLMPRVINKRNGEVVIESPWTKRIFAAPFPSMAYGALGFCIAAFGQSLPRITRYLRQITTGVRTG